MAPSSAAVGEVHNLRDFWHFARINASLELPQEPARSQSVHQEAGEELAEGPTK
jgi:hypothetical protein